LLDCGAYSQWRRGGQIDLNKYIAFIKANQKHLHLYLTLDRIPGQRGLGTSDPKVIERAAEQGHRNHLIMRGAGLRPIPVFHQRESFEWLEKYLADDEPYIAVSPFNASLPNILPWLKQCFERLQKQPRIKVHCLGISSVELMRRYPFTSVDSNTWVQAAAYGRIICPVYSAGKPDYTLKPRPVAVTERSIMRSCYLDDQPQWLQEQVHHFLSEEVATTFDEVRRELHARYRANAIYFRNFARAIGSEIYFVTGGYVGPMRDVLLRCGVDTHLLSFYERRLQSAAVLPDYVNGWKPLNQCRESSGLAPAKPL
jgi:hypothetical protein